MIAKQSSQHVIKVLMQPFVFLQNSISSGVILLHLFHVASYHRAAGLKPIKVDLAADWIYTACPVPEVERFEGSCIPTPLDPNLSLHLCTLLYFVFLQPEYLGVLLPDTGHHGRLLP